MNTDVSSVPPTADSQQKQKSKRYLLLGIKIFVSAVLLLFLLSKLDFDSLSKLKSDVIWYLLLSTLIMLSALSFMTLRWRFVLRLIEPKNYAYLYLYLFYLIGSFFNIFIPGAIGGDAMRLYYVSKLYHITKTKSLLAVFIERIAGLFALGIILLFSLLFNETIRQKLDFGFGPIALSAVGILLILFIMKHFIAKKIPIGYGPMMFILLLSGLGQFGDILISYLFCLYFGLDITILNLMSIMPLVYVATVIPISLGGVGVREGVMTAGMALYGIPVPDAVIVSFLLYFTKILIGLLGWLFYIRYNGNHINTTSQK